MTHEKIAEKIAKLIAKADSTTHPEEAETFMAKVHQMLEQHGLDLLQIGRLSEDAVGSESDAFNITSNYGWLKNCINGLARYYGCRAVMTTSYDRKRISFAIFGRESARTTLAMMVPYVERECKRLAREAFNEGHYKTRMTALTRVGNAFAIRVAQMAAEVQRPDSESKGVNALVPVDLIEQEMAEMFPNLRKSRGSAVKIDEIARRQAAKINLNRQTGGQKVRQITA